MKDERAGMSKWKDKERDSWEMRELIVNGKPIKERERENGEQHF